MVAVAPVVIITLLLTIGLASFLLPNSHFHQDFYSLNVLPKAVRGASGPAYSF